MSKRKEGYLLIDHMFSPGITEQDLISAGRFDLNPIPGGTVWESATVSCKHCNKIVVLNPKRDRPRGYCRKCDGYVCDSPECNKECVPVERVIDHLQEQAFRADSGYNPLLPLPVISPLLKR